MEIWKPVVGYEDYYEVSSYGRLKSKERIVKRKDGSERKLKERIITPIWLKRKGGYYITALVVNGHRRNMWLSQIIARAFCGPPEHEYNARVEFIDGDNTNYRADNIRWFDYSTRDANIRRDYEAGASQRELASKYNLDPTTISEITSGVIKKVVLPDDIPGERWVQADEIPGVYYVSDHGRVFDGNMYTDRGGRRNIRRQGGLMHPILSKTGYVMLQIQTGVMRRRFPVHRLVARRFVTGYDESLTVDHIDMDKTNNHFSNLRWVTSRVNTQTAAKVNNKVWLNRDYIFKLRYKMNMTYVMIGSIIGVDPETVSKFIRGVTYSESR